MSEYDIDKFGTKRWYNNKNYQLHRDDGPAVEYPNGTTVWYKNGLLHRDDGPAIEYTSGNKEWWLDGIRYDREEFILLQFSRGIIINE